MTLQKEEMKELTSLLLDMGESMMTAGGEISRVEETISRIAESYGAVKTNVFVITSSIVLTIIFPDRKEITLTRRILNSGGNDFLKLERLNDLSRNCCSTNMTIDELKETLGKINSRTPSKAKQYVGSALAAGAFAVFFGGGIIDGLIAAIFALMICFLQLKAQNVFPNQVFFYFVCSFVTGIGIYFCGKIMPILNVDKVIIGDIMIVIPGISTTNAVRDMLIGETISGAMKLVECLVIAGALAAGFMSAMFVSGGLI